MTERTFNQYVNADGLHFRYGRGEAELGRGGEYNFLGPQRITEVYVVGTELRAFDDSTDPTTIVDWHTRIPTGVHLEKADFEVQVAFAGATATLDLGLVQASDMEYALTDEDDDGIDSAIAVTAIDAVGDTIACDGALIGTVLGSDSGGYLVSAEAGTANFTAGKGLLRLYWRPVVNVTTP